MPPLCQSYCYGTTGGVQSLKLLEMYGKRMHCISVLLVTETHYLTEKVIEQG